ncbi:hypothetical protein ACIGBH_33680 [Streptomyces sp. NPDC085929]|uniref:hypothetical protein n=1 Tax=Streptomyces sp. NPDC085929 TaxID=3365739 RepID=UPI0037CF63D2
MINDQDVPDPWRVIASPIDQDSATALDAVAGLQTGAEDPVSWDVIEHSETGRRVMLRMALDETGGVVITGMYVPGDSPLGIGELRTIPLAAIEAAARNRRATRVTKVQAALLAGPAPFEGPLGRPEGPDDTQFFARLAMRYMRVAQSSTGPATDLAKAEGVTPRTIQRWTARARELGLLSQGRRGKYA